MNFKQFIKFILRELQNQLNLHIEIISNIENKPIGIGIVNHEMESMQIIELNPYFEYYKSTRNIEDIINNIKESYENNCTDVEWYRNFNNIQNNIYYMLLNEDTKDILGDAIYDKYIDLIKVYYVYSKDRGMFKDGHIVIHKHHLNMWNVTQEDIVEAAEKNMMEQPLDIRNIINILDEACKIVGKDLPEEEKESPLISMRYKDLKFGAAAICNTNALRKISEEHGNKDIFILPSSIHEILLLLSDGEDEIEKAIKLEDVVYEVNNNTLTNEDILSYNVYIYRYKTNIVEII